jgi:Protein of unknown function (DUF2530)
VLVAEHLHGLDAVTGTKPRPEPLDPPMVPFALAGTGVWAVVGVVGLAVDAPRGWLWTALAGVLLGLALLVLMAVHDRRRRRKS